MSRVESSLRQWLILSVLMRDDGHDTTGDSINSSPNVCFISFSHAVIASLFLCRINNNNKSGADTRVSHVAFTRTVLGVLLGVIVLAVDTLNPVKLFLHVFPAVEPWHIALVSTLLSIYIWISEFKELLYFIVKVFLNSILSIFFRDIEVIGRDRLPRHGPMVSNCTYRSFFTLQH